LNSKWWITTLKRQNNLNQELQQSSTTKWNGKSANKQITTKFKGHCTLSSGQVVAYTFDVLSSTEGGKHLSKVIIANNLFVLPCAKHIGQCLFNLTLLNFKHSVNFFS